MKFVCTECDEPMKFDQNGGLDEDGSMSATFRCPSCEWGVTLLSHDVFHVKGIVYQMRFDEVSAKYAEFGDFYIGIQLPARCPAFE